MKTAIIGGTGLVGAVTSHLPSDRVPTFILSLDTELVWGSFHHLSATRFEEMYPDIRSTIRRLLALLERLEISATWAVVGHLYLETCGRDRSGRAHPAMVHPQQSWRPGDWYDQDPCSDRRWAPLWYGADILDFIQACRIPQEIGCHSFAHPLYGDPLMTAEAAAADLDACLAVAKERGIVLRSFVFPQNREGHHALLRDRGFRAFRGTGREEARIGTLPATWRRPARLATHVFGTRPLLSRPAERLPGLWDVPATMQWLHRTGLRRLITRRARLHKVRAGLAAARGTDALFHLWTHPFNLSDDPEFHFGLLEEVLLLVVQERDQGRLRIETMGSLADRLSEPSAGTRATGSWPEEDIG